MKKNLTEQFNLPNYVKGKSFADASKLINNRFKDRTDKVSQETKQELLERLSNAQEFLKQQNQPQQNDSNQLMFGGIAELGEEGTESITEGAGIGDYLKGASTLMEFGKTAFGDTGIDTSGATKVEQPNVAMGAVGNTLKGVSTGASIGGPLGAAIGGGLGLVSGLIGGNKAKKEAVKAERNYDLNLANKYRPNDYNFGGFLGPGDPPKKRESGDLDFITLPKDNDQKISYANRNKLSMEQLSGFEDQTQYHKDWRKKRDNYFSTEFQKWRSGKTGRQYNEDFSQSSPEYQAAWKKIKDTWYKENPREVNDVVKDYYTNGAKGRGQGQTFGFPTTSPDRELLATNQMAKGGYTNQYDGIKLPTNFLDIINNKITMPDFGSMTGTSEDIHNPKTITVNNSTLNKKQNETVKRENINFDINPGKSSSAEQSKVGKGINKGLDWLGNNYSSILRYAPLVGNLTNRLDRPETPRGTRLDNVYKKQMFDEAALLNSVNQNNLNQGLKEASAGNLGSLSTNLLAAHLNKRKALSEGYFKGRQQNIDENRFQFSNNLAKDRINANLDLDFLNRKAQDEGAYNTAKLANRNAIFEDVGKIGKEETYKKMVKEMFGYSWNGKYWTDKKGNKIEDSVVRAKINKKNK